MIFDYREKMDVKWQRALDRALGSWESVVEWADYISFLARVQKAVKAGKGEMPESPRIAEMLSRCLDPGLPAGVHQKVLDVYSSVLDVIGDEQLERETNVWLPGILPLVSYATFSVKPIVLGVLKQVLGRVSSPSLHELCQPVFLSCLPSLEESESYSDVMAVLDLLQEHVSDDAWFWQSFLLCVMTSTEVRLGALSWLQKHFPSFDDPRNYAPVVSPDPGLLVRALCAGLEDTNVLVQRGFLDLLVQSLPLSLQIYSSIDKADHLLLVKAAVLTILRRDMSLNRRLWVWLLGPDPDLEANNPMLTRREYLDKYALDSLVQVLLGLLIDDPPTSFVVAHGLMDRWELGSQVAPRFLIPVLRKCCEQPQMAANASRFFDGVESNMVWNSALQLLEEGDLATVEFLCNNFDVSEPDMQSIYIPLVLLWVLRHSISADPESTTEHVARSLARLVAPLAPPKDPSVTHTTQLTAQDIKRWFRHSIQANTGDGDGPAPPLDSGELTWELLCASNDDELLVILLDKLPPGSMPALAPLVPKWAGRCNYPELLVRLHMHLAAVTVAQAVHTIVKEAVVILQGSGENQVELVRELWVVHEAVRTHLVESALAGEVAASAPAAGARVVAALWAHSTERQDFADLLAKPTLLVLDRFPDDIACRMAIEAVVVRTGTAPKLISLIIDKLLKVIDDLPVLRYYLGVLLRLATNLADIRRALIQRHWKPLAELLLERQIVCVEALELAKLACLDPLTPDGTIWLGRFVEVVVASVNRSGAEGVLFCASVANQLGTRANSMLAPLLRGAPIATDWDCVAFTELVDAYVTSGTGINGLDAESIVGALLERLETVEPPVIHTDLSQVHNSTSLTQLVGCVERVLQAAIHSSSTVPPSSSSEGLGQVLGGVFSVETPTDRTAQAESREALRRACEAAVARCCRYWRFVERVRIGDGPNNGPKTLSSALYAQGRLKTRVRKLLTLVYSQMPGDTLAWMAANLDMDFAMATRAAHMFGGNPLSLSTTNPLLSGEQQFAFVDAYVSSLELDALEDTWPALATYLGGVASSPGNITGKALAFAAQLGTWLDRARLTQRRRVRKEFNEVLSKLVSSALSAGNIAPEIWTSVIQLSADTIGDTLLGKVLSQVVMPGLPVMIPVLNALVDKASAKVWKTAVGDFLFDSRLFELRVDDALAFRPVVQAWLAADKDRMQEFVGKIASYGSNSVLFGWSGSQKLATENLNRLAYLFLCGATLPVHWGRLLNQLAALWDSGNFRVLVVLRAVVFATHNQAVTAFTAFRLQQVFHQSLSSDAGVDEDKVVEACRTLDLCIAVGAHEWQMYQWLFVSDSTDAIYTSTGGSGRAIDRLARVTLPASFSGGELELPASASKDPRRPLLPPRASPPYMNAFFNSLSITLYGEKYRLAPVDEDYCRHWILSDIFH